MSIYEQDNEYVFHGNGIYLFNQVTVLKRGDINFEKL